MWRVGVSVGRGRSHGRDMFPLSYQSCVLLGEAITSTNNRPSRRRSFEFHRRRSSPGMRRMGSILCPQGNAFPPKRQLNENSATQIVGEWDWSRRGHGFVAVWAVSHCLCHCLGGVMVLFPLVSDFHIPPSEVGCLT